VVRYQAVRSSLAVHIFTAIVQSFDFCFAIISDMIVFLQQKHGERVMPEFKTIAVLLLLLTSLLLYFTGTLSALSTRLVSR